jgi:hypothetical protein
MLGGAGFMFHLETLELPAVAATCEGWAATGAATGAAGFGGWGFTKAFLLKWSNIWSRDLKGLSRYM